jgi:hypothetical protein
MLAGYQYFTSSCHQTNQPKRMPPYFALAVMWVSAWLIFFIFRKQERQKMLTMSLAVLPFAFFDYYSQPSYWHPQTLFSMPVGIEGILFGFSFGGVAAVIYPAEEDKRSETINIIDLKNVFTLIPVLVISLGLHLFINVNMMISLPVALFTGCILIAWLKPALRRRLLYSGCFWGLLYMAILFAWLLLFPSAQAWWQLGIYGNVTVLNVPLGEVLFGFLFGAFWGVVYEFIFTRKPVLLRSSAGRILLSEFSDDV